eukprot:1022477-Karenia_brevis.AAC.1
MVFNVAKLEQFMDQSWNTSRKSEDQPAKAANTLTYAQRKKMQARYMVSEGNIILKPETLDPAYIVRCSQIGRSSDNL